MGLKTRLLSLSRWRGFSTSRLVDRVAKVCRIPPHPSRINTTLLLAAATLTMIGISGAYSLQLILLAQNVVSTTQVSVTSPTLVQRIDGSFLVSFLGTSNIGESMVLLSSSEDGLCWRRLEPPTGQWFGNIWPYQPSVGLFPTCTSLVQCKDGSYMLAYAVNEADGTSDIYVTTSADGHEWETPTRVRIPTNEYITPYRVYRLSLIQRQDGLFEIAYQSVAPSSSGLLSMTLTLSSTDGESWNNLRPVYSVLYRRILWSPALLQRSDGSYVVAIREPEQIVLLESVDGSSWQTVSVIPAPVPKGYYTGLSLVQRTDGTYLLAFDDGETRVYARSSSDGRAWSGASAVTEGSHPSLAALPDGSCLMAFSRNDGIYVLRSLDGIEWDAPVVVDAVQSSGAGSLPTYVTLGLLWAVSIAFMGALVVGRGRLSRRNVGEYGAG